MTDFREASAEHSPAATDGSWQLERRHRRNRPQPSQQMANNRVGGHGAFSSGGRRSTEPNNVRRQGEYAHGSPYGNSRGNSNHSDYKSNFAGHGASGGSFSRKKGGTSEGASGASNGNAAKGRSAKSAQEGAIEILRSRGVCQEILDKVEQIKAEYGYFSIEEIYYTLKNLDYGVTETIDALIEKKNNSWSSLIQRNISCSNAAPSSQSEQCRATDECAQRKGKKVVSQPSPAPAPPPDIDPAAVSLSIEECLKETQEATKMLMELKRELFNSINNQQLGEQLNSEKQQLLERKKEISKENLIIDERLAQIEKELVQLNLETINKVTQIAQKLPKAGGVHSLIKNRG
ncbi:uncharacterized protein LOC126329920 [Schistocerca gregaria]|uniref:uncharacterized protein LOC126329920 n=1 Tax=Schistocerca gregaria TaxID=7010 RepID=UPI00211EAC39|nr:uncharacterized protein LOC126329920 [Schistocerca gregaria]